jgi:hypothetical protein
MVLEGRAFLVKAGATVTVEDWDAWRNIEQIRVRSFPDTFYTTVDAGR